MQIYGFSKKKVLKAFFLSDCEKKTPEIGCGMNFDAIFTETF